LINVVITVTKVRKSIIKAIPSGLQNAIGGGIGLFIAYIGLKSGGLLKFTLDPGTYTESFGTIFGNASAVPAITDFTSAAPILAIIGLVITVVLLVAKVRGAILIGIIATTVIGIPMGVTNLSTMFQFDIASPFVGLGQTFGACFTGIGSLFADPAQIPMAILAIFAFSLSDTFDTIGTFIGTGRRSGVFTDEDLASVENGTGFSTKMERALFADSIATSVGAIFGTSNTTTYIESAAGIEAGGKTGLTSAFTAVLFLLCILISPIVGVVPAAATAPALIIVGIMMAASFKSIEWTDLKEAIPAFIAALVMTVAYSISTGIAFGFIFYIIVKVASGKAKDVHPIVWGSSALFLAYFVLMALLEGGIIG
jgi:AGZA family xanthine/uracil permease-like MFS transporter